MTKPVNVLIRSGKDGGGKLFRQSPGGKLEWGNVHFVLDISELDHVDWLVVCHSSSIREAIKARVDPSHIRRRAWRAPFRRAAPTHRHCQSALPQPAGVDFG